MFDTFLSVLPVFAMILAGYGAARTGILPASANRDLNRFVVCTSRGKTRAPTM